MVAIIERKAFYPNSSFDCKPLEQMRRGLALDLLFTRNRLWLMTGTGIGL